MRSPSGRPLPSAMGGDCSSGSRPTTTTNLSVRAPTSASSSTCAGSWHASPARSPKTMSVVGRTVPGARLGLGDVRSSRAHLDHRASISRCRLSGHHGAMASSSMPRYVVLWGIAPDTHNLCPTRASPTNVLQDPERGSAAWLRSRWFPSRASPFERHADSRRPALRQKADGAGR